MKNIMEVWRPINGYEGLYEISNTGIVKSHYNGGRILTVHIDRQGYCSVMLYCRGISQNQGSSVGNPLHKQSL